MTRALSTAAYLFSYIAALMVGVCLGRGLIMLALINTALLGANLLFRAILEPLTREGTP